MASQITSLTPVLLKDKHAHERDTHIVFQERGHTYYIKRERGYTSVTTLIHKAFEKFNADKIIDGMMNSPKWSDSKYFGMTKPEIKQMWNKNGQEAAKMGTAMHEMFEFHYNGIHEDKIASFKEIK